MADLLASPSVGVLPTVVATTPADELSYESRTLATRHLCAGVHVDRDFRDQIIRKIHNDSRHRVAPSYGFDLVPVVRNAWRSWFLDLGWLVSLVGTLCVGFVLGHRLAVLLLGCALVAWVLFRRAGRLFADVIRLKSEVVAGRWGWRNESGARPTPGPASLPQYKRRLIATLGAGLVVIIVAVTAADLGSARIAQEARPAAILAAVLLLCTGLAGIVQNRQLAAARRSDSLRPRSLSRRERAIDRQQIHPCVMYARPITDATGEELLPGNGPAKVWSPFLGSGRLVNRWSPPMTVPLLRTGVHGEPQEEYATPPFLAHELVERLRSALQLLATDHGPERLPGLRVRDRLYVAGGDVAIDRDLLDAAQNTQQLWRVIDNHQLPADHFLEASAPIAQGELVVTILTRVSVKGRCLSLDVATTALTRTPSVYQHHGRSGTTAAARCAARSIFALPADVVELWRILDAPLTLLRAWWVSRGRKAGLEDRSHLGPGFAIREEKADSWQNSQLDRTTIYDHMKIVEQRILKTTRDFLEARNVDISAFETRATNIINSGVLNMGGVVDITQSAIGTNAELNQIMAEGQSA